MANIVYVSRAPWQQLGSVRRPTQSRYCWWKKSCTPSGKVVSLQSLKGIHTHQSVSCIQKNEELVVSDSLLIVIIDTSLFNLSVFFCFHLRHVFAKVVTSLQVSVMIRKQTVDKIQTGVSSESLLSLPSQMWHMNIWVFSKIKVPQKWMVYNGKPY